MTESPALISRLPSPRGGLWRLLPPAGGLGKLRGQKSPERFFPAHPGGKEMETGLAQTSSSAASGLCHLGQGAVRLRASVGPL